MFLTFGIDGLVVTCCIKAVNRKGKQGRAVKFRVVIVSTKSKINLCFVQMFVFFTNLI